MLVTLLLIASNQPAQPSTVTIERDNVEVNQSCALAFELRRVR